MTVPELSLGVMIPAVATGGEALPNIAHHARAAEDAGLDSIWVGDHVATPAASLDAIVALSAAAVATTKVSVGTAVLVPALRPLLLLAKQVASLQFLAEGRLIVGVGTGGPWPDQWAAAGVDPADRVTLTERALVRLPPLLRGEMTCLEGQAGDPEVALTPVVSPPPLWVGRAGRAVLRRAAALGDGWLPSLVTPDEVRDGRHQLETFAAEYGRPVPTVAVGVTVGVDQPADVVDAVTGSLASGYGFSDEHAKQIVISGAAPEVAERLGSYAESGATHLLIGTFGDSSTAVYERLAEVAALMR